jgi:WD40 repeat protein
VDFKMMRSPNQNSKADQGIIATAGDDGNIYIYNHSSHRIENVLSKDNHVEVKVCKFLQNTDCIVSADMDGYLNFWAMTPHVCKA